jgi:hypothetical protein
MYAVTLKELKVILKVSAQAGQSGAVNKTSVESTVLDHDFQEVKRRRGLISNDTSQTAKNSTKPVPAFAAEKLPPKAVIYNFFTSLRSTDMDSKTSGTENTLPERQAPRKPVGPPPIVMICTTNLIRLQSDIKGHVNGEYEFRNTLNETHIITK